MRKSRLSQSVAFCAAEGLSGVQFEPSCRAEGFGSSERRTLSVSYAKAACAIWVGCCGWLKLFVRRSAHSEVLPKKVNLVFHLLEVCYMILFVA